MEDSKSKDRLIDILLKRKINLGTIEFQIVDFIFIICLWVFGYLIRYKLYPIESADYFGFLKQWMDRIKELGGFKSLGTAISNYTSPYMYLMCLVSGCENTLYALKNISVVFDYLASIAMFLNVYELTKNTKKAILGMAMVILSPTLILDSAYWCQCDIIYTCFILYAFYFFFKEKSNICMLFIGIAFSFKLQTVFILPFFIIMWLKKKTVRIIDFVYIPAVYIIMQLPAVFFGRSFTELMTVYFDQAGYYPWGTLEYPNLYALLDETIDSNHHMYEVGASGTFVTIIMLGVLAYYLYTKEFEITTNIIVTTALFSVGIVAYTLPHMHDRYGFLIDLLAILYAVLRPKKFPVCVGFMVVSIIAFMPYLIAVDIFSIRVNAVALLALIVYVGYDLYSLLADSTSNSCTK